MDWRSELEITSKKLIPRLGRRAGQPSNQDDKKSDDEVLESSISPLSDRSLMSSGVQQPVAPPRSRKAGWGDELKSGGKTKAASNLIEQERFRDRSKEESEEDIPVIPDLDEIQEDNVSAEVPNAPTVGVNRVAAYRELDTDLYRSTVLSSLDDINLSLLTEKLYPEKLVREPDEVWNWDLLFTQLTSEINSEKQNAVVP